MIRASDITGDWILSLRGHRNTVDPFRPYAWLVEKERTAVGTVEDVGIIFLTNRECPFQCLMCDLWKNTTEYTVPEGSITAQIEWALGEMPRVRHLKLYNSGSFFDSRAILQNDLARIARIAEEFETLIVECHPLFVDERVIHFSRLMRTQLEVAMGLETSDNNLLKKLNKKMSSSDFEKAVTYLTGNGIRSRAFILLRPPFLSEEEGISDAERSIDFAFASGVGCCTVIPVRGGNGAMEVLKKTGQFMPPAITSLETVLEYGISLNSGRVFADTWDLALFTSCDACLVKRTERLNQMNLTQQIPEKVICNCNS